MGENSGHGGTVEVLQEEKGEYGGRIGGVLSMEGR